MSYFYRADREGRLRETVAEIEHELRRRESSYNPFNRYSPALKELRRQISVGISSALTHSYREKSQVKGQAIRGKLEARVGHYLIKSPHSSSLLNKDQTLEFSHLILKNDDLELVALLELIEYAKAWTYLCEAIPINPIWGLHANLGLQSAVESYLENSENPYAKPDSKRYHEMQSISNIAADRTIKLLAKSIKKPRDALEIISENGLNVFFDSSRVIAKLINVACKLVGIFDRNWNRHEAELEKEQINAIEFRNVIINLRRIIDFLNRGY